MITPDPMPVARLIEIVQIEDPLTEEDTVRTAIHQMVAAYQDPARPLARGFRIDEVAGGLQFRTVPENAAFVRRYLSAKPQKLSKPALETLSIIAYRQPVTKPEVEAIRGVDVGAAMKNLLDRDFIRILGKKDEIGRPIIYGTTEVFLEFFGLRSLAELPTLREFHDLDDEHRKEVEALGGDKPSVQDLAEAAQFMVEVKDDPDLDTLDKAVHHADTVGKAAEAALSPDKPVESAEALEVELAPVENEESTTDGESAASEPEDSGSDNDGAEAPAASDDAEAESQD